MAGLAIAEPGGDGGIFAFSATGLLAVGLVLKSDAEDLTWVWDHSQPGDLGEVVPRRLRHGGNDVDQDRVVSSNHLVNNGMSGNHSALKHSGSNDLCYRF